MPTFLLTFWALCVYWSAIGPSAEPLPTNYIYTALIILVLGVMLGKFFP